MQRALDLAGIVPWGWDETTHTKVWSAETKALFGLPPEAAMSQALFESLLHPDDLPRYRAAWAAALDPHGDGIYRLDYRIRRAGDDEERWLSSMGTVMFDGDRPVRVVGSLRDVTEERRLTPPDDRQRRRADAAWAERPFEQSAPGDGGGAHGGGALDVPRAVSASDERFRLLFEQSADGFFLADASGRFVDVNEAGCRMLGHSREDILALSVTDVLASHEVPRMPARMAGLEGGHVTATELIFRRKDGTTFIGEMSGRQLPDGRLQGIFRDVSARKASEEALRRSEERLQHALTAASAGAWEVTPATGEFWASDQALALHGLPPGEPMTHERALAAAHPDDRALIADALQRTLETGAPLQMETRAVLPDGTVRWLSTHAELRDGLPHPRIVGLSIDVTARRTAEDALRTAHDTFRHLVERSPFDIYVVDADFRIYQVSDGAQRVFETVRPLIGRDLGEVLRILWQEPFASEAIGRFRHTLATGEPYFAGSTTERRADIAATEAYDWKVERIGMPDGRPGVVCHFYDLTERKQHEEQIDLLMREVNHRAKNMLSLVQAIAHQTAATRPDDFIERFSMRIQALGANQDLLVKGDWKAVPLADLIRSQLAHFGDLRDRRVSLSGPAIEVKAAASQTLGMALHELATNAVKYGALSDDFGRVEISWGIGADDGKAPRFTMAWV